MSEKPLGSFLAVPQFVLSLITGYRKLTIEEYVEKRKPVL